MAGLKTMFTTNTFDETCPACGSDPCTCGGDDEYYKCPSCHSDPCKCDGDEENFEEDLI